MNAIPELRSLLDTPLAQAVGWALLQFVWQGALVGVVAATALLLLRQSGPDIRYLVGTIAMSLMLTLPVVGVIQELNIAAGPQQSSDRVTTTSIESLAAVSSAGVMRRSEGQSAPIVRSADTAVRAPQSYRLASWLLLGWIVGVALLTARLISGWLWIQRLRMHGTPAASSLREGGERLARRLHITRAVCIVQSAAVEVPTVMGWLKPVILFPASALAGLSPAHLEAVLAHELAHVRRHDYLVNLLQTIVETLLFYHPAVWWVSRQIRIERENCCDDLAVKLCGDRVLYAQALADLEQLRSSSGRFALAADGGSLVDRVRRLLGAPSHASTTPGWLAAGIAVAIVVSIAGIGARAMDREGQKSATQAAPSERSRARVEGSKPAFTRAEVEQALRSFDRALNRALRDLFSQVPPVPPVPSEPPEPPMPPEPPQRLPALPPEPAEPLEPPQPPALLEPVEVPLPPEPIAPMELPHPPALVPPPAAPVGPPAPVPPAAPLAQSKSSGNFVHSNNGEKLEVNYRGDFEFTDDDSDVKSMSPDGWLRIKETGRNGAHTVEFRADAAGKIERRYWSGTSERPFDSEGRKWLTQILPRFIRQTGLGAESRVRRIYKTKGAQGVLSEIALIEGSWAKRIYFRELFKNPGLDARVAQQALDQAGREIDSDFELASLLISADHLLTDDATRKSYIEAARSIDSDFEMRRVYSSVVKRGPLPAPALTALLESSTAIGSDFEEASLLIEVAKQQSLSDANRGAFFKAVSTIESDFEQRRVLSSIVTRSDASPAILGAILDSAVSIGSDFELATILIEVVRNYSVEGTLRAAFFRAVDSLQSDFERARVLQALAKRSDASHETVLEIIRATAKMHGDFESARVLLIVAGSHPLTSEARDAYVDAAERLGQFEQGRVLSALVKNERRK